VAIQFFEQFKDFCPIFHESLLLGEQALFENQGLAYESFVHIRCKHKGQSS
jgi:hypothetical protein